MQNGILLSLALEIPSIKPAVDRCELIPKRSSRSVVVR